MSNRVMSILRGFSPDQEVYSIDESFLDLTSFQRRDLIKYGQLIRSTILQGTGLPVCVGIASTKTLAKLANHCAKKRPVYDGVCNFNSMSEIELDFILNEIDVGEIWGVGRKLAPKLRQLGFNTVLDLKRADPAILRQNFSVVMEKTIRELNGTVCIELEEVTPAKQQILSSRSFGTPVTDINGLSESISLYVSRAAEKLRRQNSFAGSLYIYIRTSPFRDKDPQYSNGMTIKLPSPTDSTPKLVNIALWGLKQIYRPGYNYAKAGIMLSELVPASGIQTDLFSNMQPDPKSERLMQVMDLINRKMGKETIKVASEGFKRPWKMKQENKSPCYTTNWDELLKVD
jgi:DNA polymerase V